MLAAGEGVERPKVVLITDPGPDPDDVKAIIVLNLLRLQSALADVCAVIANGGGVPLKRARLARKVLDHLGMVDVPVGIGSRGTAVLESKHEYDLDGVFRDEHCDSRITSGYSLLLRVLEAASTSSITVIIISSLRDMADIIDAHEDLVLEKVKGITVQGGMTYHEASGRWLPDDSSNNLFDPDAAARVYDFCTSKGVPLVVVSRNAVPMVPGSIASKHARDAVVSPLMEYVSNAQLLGLKGLWQRLCAGMLPPRCTKRWFFQTFCSTACAAVDFDALDTADDISHLLDGSVKPYDVVAVLAAIPKTMAMFPQALVVESGGVLHRMYATDQHAPSLSYLVTVLDAAYTAANEQHTRESVYDTPPLLKRFLYAENGGSMYS